MEDFNKILGEAARDEIRRQRVNANLNNVIPSIDWAEVGRAVSRAAVEIEIKKEQDLRDFCLSVGGCR
jgi:hypothetical protein